MLHLGSGQSVPPEHRYPKLSVCVGKGLGSWETAVGDPWPGTFSAWSWELVFPTMVEKGQNYNRQGFGMPWECLFVYSLFLSASKLNTGSFCFQWFSYYQLTYCSSWLLHLTILLARQIYVGLLLGIFVFQFLWLFGSYARARHLSALQVAAGEGGGQAGELSQFGSIGGLNLKDSPLKNVGKNCPFSRCFLLNGGSNIM